MGKLKKGMTVFYNRTNGETVTGTIVKQTRNNATYIDCDDPGRIVAAPSDRVFETRYFYDGDYVTYSEYKVSYLNKTE